MTAKVQPVCPFCLTNPSIASGTTAGDELIRFCLSCLKQAKHHKTVSSVLMDSRKNPDLK